MRVIVCDFETYYDKAFSLSKMTTEEYIRDELFEVIGVAVKVDDGETEWFSGTRKKTSEWLDQFPWDDALAVAHNAMFDMAILNWHFDIRPKMIADTLSMARAIDGPDAGNSLAKLAERHGLGVKGTEVVNALGKGRLDFTPEELARYGDYCINDVELTYELFKKLVPNGPEYELQRLFYECAGSSFRESFAPLMELVTVRQMLFGSDYPWGRLSIQQTIDGLLKQGFSPAELRLIERENALGLFPRFR